MEIRGVGIDEVRRIVGAVSAERYEGNVKLHNDAREAGVRKPKTLGRIDVRSSRGPGARRSSSGRRMPAACWHVFRDCFGAILTEYPDATIVTGMATYRGMAGFLDAYPATGLANIGSAVAPATMPELCECDAACPSYATTAEQWSA